MESRAEEGREESQSCTHPEMLCWLREEEMSLQEFQQRVDCVITHVGECPVFIPPSAISHQPHWGLWGGKGYVPGRERGSREVIPSSCSLDGLPIPGSILRNAQIWNCFIIEIHV